MFTNENGTSLDDRLHYHIAQAGSKNIGEVVWEGGEIARLKQSKGRAIFIRKWFAKSKSMRTSRRRRDQLLRGINRSYFGIAHITAVGGTMRWGREASRRARRGEGEGDHFSEAYSLTTNGAAK